MATKRPETFRIHSPAWDHQKLFTGARALERELGLTPLRSRTRERERLKRKYHLQRGVIPIG